MRCGLEGKSADKQNKESGGTTTFSPEMFFRQLNQCEIAEWAAKHFGSMLSAMSENDLGTLDDYKNEWSYEINTELRSNSGQAFEYESDVENLDRILSRCVIPMRIHTFRACYAKSFHGLENASVGDVVCDDGYTSTTLWEEAGKRFLDDYFCVRELDAEKSDWEIVFVTINIPPGTKGLYMDYVWEEGSNVSFPEYPGEAEVMLARGTHFVLKNVQWTRLKDGEKVKVYQLEAIPGSDVVSQRS